MTQGPRSLNRKISLLDKLKHYLSAQNPKGGSQIIFLGIGVLIIIMAFTSFYTVQPDEQSVVLRFGEYSKTTDPGLHFKLPLGIDEAIKVKTKLVLQQDFGFRTRQGIGGSSRTGHESESLMLTGDLNVADVEWIVQFQISDPQKFLFKTRDPIANVRDIAQAIMRRVVGDRLVTDVLTVGRIEIADEAMQLMQEVLDKYNMGVRIVSIKLQDVNPPEPVKPSFNDVNAAKQEQEQLINQAERKYNEVIPEAQGQAEKLVAEARGEATAILNRARGDVTRFDAVLKEYRLAPEVTRTRIYLDAMETIFSDKENLTLIDSELKGLLPILNLSGRGSGNSASQGDR